MDQGRAARKQRILAGRATGVVHSIADAVVIKNRNIYFLSRQDGSLPLTEDHGFGLYYDDCRYLSGYQLKMGDGQARVLVADASQGLSAVYQFTNPEIEKDGQTHARMDEVNVTWRRHIDARRCRMGESLRFMNNGRDRNELPLSLTFRCDFRDLFAIRGLWPRQPGELRDPEWHDGVLIFGYAGADDVYRSLHVRFDPPPDRIDGTTVYYDLSLEARQSHEIDLSFDILQSSDKESLQPVKRDTPVQSDAGSGTEPDAGSEAETDAEQWMEDHTWVQSDSLLLNAIMDRSLGDLGMLRSFLGDEEYFAAGVPWYVALFGRDSIITALQTLAYDPEVSRETLELLAHYQAREVDEWRDAQPGKILHELRVGELAHLGQIPHTPYYGSIDATPLFLLLVARHAAWTGSLALFQKLRENVDLALDWIDRYGDLDGDGYVEYDSVTDHALINQGWKDSGDAIVNADGTLAEPPIALVEVQGYVYRAKLEIASLFERSGEPERAAQLRREAQELRERFDRDFWLDDLGCYALALQAGNRPVALLTSNAGHTLWTGIASAEHGRQTAQRLMEDDMFSGWGIRTVSAAAGCYNPTAYHLGTVWPHDNALIAAGMRRYGYDDAAHRILQGMIRAAMNFEGYRLPELFSGFSRDDYGVPVPYPIASHPQAWSAGAIPHLLITHLGLQAEAFENRLRLVRPALPDYVDRLHVRGLRVGGGEVDLRFERTGKGHSAVEVTDVQGDVDVLIDAGPGPGGEQNDQ
jgi:glycogen debranching enzyme